MNIEFLTRKQDVQPPFHFFQEIADAFTRELHLLPVSAYELERSFGEGLAVVGVWGERPVAFTRLVHLLGPDHLEGEWLELGSTWVHPDARGQDINSRIYEMFLPEHTGRNILATTTNKISRHIGDKVGLVTVPRKLLPEAVWRASCVCSPEKTRTRDNAHCLLAWGEAQQCGGPCWFRVTRETAERLGLV